jgi:hypothetical protein
MKGYELAGEAPGCRLCPFETMLQRLFALGVRPLDHVYIATPRALE